MLLNREVSVIFETKCKLLIKLIAYSDVVIAFHISFSFDIGGINTA